MDVCAGVIADDKTVRAFVLGLSLGLCAGDIIADERIVRAFVVPVLGGIVCEASVHSPTLQSDATTVTVTDSCVNIGAMPPRDSVR